MVAAPAIAGGGSCERVPPAKSGQGPVRSSWSEEDSPAKRNEHRSMQMPSDRRGHRPREEPREKNKDRRGSKRRGGGSRGHEQTRAGRKEENAASRRERADGKGRGEDLPRTTAGKKGEKRERDEKRDTRKTFEREQREVVRKKIHDTRGGGARGRSEEVRFERGSDSHKRQQSPPGGKPPGDFAGAHPPQPGQLMPVPGPPPPQPEHPMQHWARQTPHPIGGWTSQCERPQGQCWFAPAAAIWQPGNDGDGGDKGGGTSEGKDRGKGPKGGGCSEHRGSKKRKFKGEGRGDGDAGMRMCGTFMASFVVIGNDANVDEVSADLRKYATTVMLVHCGNVPFAQDLRDKLSQASQEPIGAERKEVKFITETWGTWIVCGRSGIVQEVRIRIAEETAGAGLLLTAKVEFVRAICNTMEVCVAVWDFPKRVDVLEEGFEEPAVAGRERTWAFARSMLTDEFVRIVVGDFGKYLKPLLRFLRATMKVDIAASKAINRSSPDDTYILWVGPVNKLRLDKSVSRVDQWVGEDCTQEWPLFPIVKQKNPNVDIPNVAKLAISVGASDQWGCEGRSPA